MHINIYNLKFIQMRGGEKYFITIIDDYTRYYCVYLLRIKNKALEVFKHYKNYVEN